MAVVSDGYAEMWVSGGGIPLRLWRNSEIREIEFMNNNAALFSLGCSEFTRKVLHEYGIVIKCLKATRLLTIHKEIDSAYSASSIILSIVENGIILTKSVGALQLVQKSIAFLQDRVVCYEALVDHLKALMVELQITVLMTYEWQFCGVVETQCTNGPRVNTGKGLSKFLIKEQCELYFIRRKS